MVKIHPSNAQKTTSVLTAPANPYGQKIHPSQVPDQSHPVNSHRRQPRAQPLNPAQAAAAPGTHDPSALLCLTSTPKQPPRKPAHAIPPHTSQALERRTAQQPNTLVSGLLTPSFP